MRIQIENERFSAQVDVQGAELCSLQRKEDGAQFIWQGDARYWAGHAPTLFPVNLRFYLTPGNKSKDNIVRAAAPLVLNLSLIHI